MLKALKVTMIVRGVVGILFGLAFIFIPKALGEMFGYATEGGPEYILSFLASLGVFMISVAIFLIAAARDPLRHIYWVKLAILIAILMVVAELYSVIQGYIDFSQAGMGIILNAVFAVAFLVFYPWRAGSISE